MYKEYHGNDKHKIHDWLFEKETEGMRGGRGGTQEQLEEW